METETEGQILEARCECCGRSIDWPEVRIGERTYCCEACAAGEGCDCPDLGGRRDAEQALRPLWIDLARS